MNNITIELCAEDRARLDRLGDLTEKLLRERCEGCVETVKDAFEKATAPAEAQTAAPVNPADEHPVADPFDAAPVQEAPKPETKAPTVTLEQIQQKVVQIAAAGGEKKAKAREIINAYGTKVSDLKDKPDKWDEVWAQLTALEG